MTRKESTRCVKRKSKTAKADYGKQCLLDGYGADSKKLADVGLLYQTLNSLPQIIGMRKVGFPQIIEFKEQPIAGISGFIFIVESHISIHTYCEQGFISLDIYSCKRLS